MSKLPLPQRSARTGTQPRGHAPQALRASERCAARTRAGPSAPSCPKITQKVFEKFGFSTATLLTDWAIIVGRDLAVYTAPDRLKWPRGFEGGAVAGEEGGGRPGATLMLRVEPARALDIQYKSRLVIDRINAYFGYRAVAEIRLIQMPMPLGASEQSVVRTVPLQTGSSIVPVEAGDELGEALRELEASIRAKKSRRPGAAVAKL